MILLFNLDSINKELVTKIARKSYQDITSSSFFKFDNVCIKKNVCVRSICALNGSRAGL